MFKETRAFHGVVLKKILNDAVGYAVFISNFVKCLLILDDYIALISFSMEALLEFCTFNKRLVTSFNLK